MTLQKISLEDKAPFILQAIKNKKKIVVRKFPLNIKGMLVTSKQKKEYMLSSYVIKNQSIMWAYGLVKSNINPHSGTIIMDHEMVDIYDRYCMIFSPELEAYYSIDRLIEIYKTASANFKYNRPEKEDTEKADQVALKLVKHIKKLKWDDYIEHEGMLLGKPHVVDDIHVANECGGRIVARTDIANNHIVTNGHVCSKCGDMINFRCFGF